MDVLLWLSAKLFDVSKARNQGTQSRDTRFENGYDNASAYAAYPAEDTERCSRMYRPLWKGGHSSPFTCRMSLFLGYLTSQQYAKYILGTDLLTQVYILPD